MTAGPGTPRTLRRVADDRAVLGLCAGLARALDVPVAGVRLVVVVAAFLAPTVVLAAYAAGALIVPRDDGRALLGGVPSDGRDVAVGWSLATVAALFLLYRWVDPLSALRSVVADPYTVVHAVGYDDLRLLVSAPVLLLALGFGLWLALRRPAPVPAPSATGTAAAPGEQPTVVLRDRSVAPYGVAGVAAVLAVAAGLTALGYVRPATGAIAAVAAACAVVCGVAGIALNGRRGVAVLLGLAVILAGATVVVAALPAELRGRIGDRTVHVLSVADLRSQYRQGIGDLDLDLRDVRLPPGETRVAAGVGFGSLTVHVPRGVRVETTGPTTVLGAYPGPPKHRRLPALLVQADIYAGGSATVVRDGP